jgi:hypothetical protein
MASGALGLGRVDLVANDTAAAAAKASFGDGYEHLERVEPWLIRPTSPRSRRSSPS